MTDMTPEPEDPFETALAALLEPLARAMIARGVTLGTAHEAMKKALLDAALAGSQGRLSDSRVSLMTGLHRKDIKRLRSKDPDQPVRRQVNAAARVLGYWAADRAFLDRDRQPRDLDRASGKAGPGFDELVRRARVDMAPGTMLQALMDQGAVRVLADGTIRMVTQALVPEAGSAEQIAAYQATLSAHFDAATRNLLATEDAPRHFDRAVRYSHLSDASVEALRDKADALAQQLLEEINAQAHALQDSDDAGGHAGRFVLGAYVLATPDAEDDTGLESDA
jgi:hypothetical protein